MTRTRPRRCSCWPCRWRSSSSGSVACRKRSSALATRPIWPLLPALTAPAFHPGSRRDRRIDLTSSKGRPRCHLTAFQGYEIASEKTNKQTNKTKKSQHFGEERMIHSGEEFRGNSLAVKRESLRKRTLLKQTRRQQQQIIMQQQQQK